MKPDIEIRMYILYLTARYAEMLGAYAVHRFGDA